ncbi:hypothetical protein OHC33_004159 [Knufia fluminis]|uniref:Uncharacterized protein n=1 Tax=Knufia fluminis TaxID=191047 RepID=A0AAN8I4R5_9EURO|nr:hypothetical protein OHC33_004159 [Knufia fluminis]
MRSKRNEMRCVKKSDRAAAANDKAKGMAITAGVKKPTTDVKKSSHSSTPAFRSLTFRPRIATTATSIATIISPSDIPDLPDYESDTDDNLATKSSARAESASEPYTLPPIYVNTNIGQLLMRCLLWTVEVPSYWSQVINGVKFEYVAEGHKVKKAKSRFRGDPWRRRKAVAGAEAKAVKDDKVNMSVDE